MPVGAPYLQSLGGVVSADDKVNNTIPISFEFSQTWERFASTYLYRREFMRESVPFPATSIGADRT